MDGVWREIFGDFVQVDNIPTGAYPFAPVFRRIGALSVGRQVFYSPRRVYGEVNVQYYRLRSEGREVRKVVFLSKGEPTLDANLGREAKALKVAGFSLEILTCGAMLWREDVRDDLSQFDRVVLEMATVDEESWKEVMRPHPLLTYRKVMEGIRVFAGGYDGKVDVLMRVVKGVPYSADGVRLKNLFEELGVSTVFVLPEGGDLRSLLKGLREGKFNTKEVGVGYRGEFQRYNMENGRT